jgi:cytochrome c oxidase subunit 2
VSAVLALLGAGPLGIGLPHDASKDGWRIDEMINVTSVFVGIIFAVMMVWMLWAIIGHGPRHSASHDHGDRPNSWLWTLAVAGLVFVVVDGDLLVRTFVSLNLVFWNFDWAERQPDAVRIEINAHQWAWSVRYAGPDGVFNTADDVVTLNDVVLPRDAPALFQVASTDVLHGFNVPSMRMKVDAVPGTVNRMWFTPAENGDFEIGCAQHCGANHYKMRGTVHVVDRALYEQWLGAASANAVRGFDAKDEAAHWGWDWSEHARMK